MASPIINRAFNKPASPDGVAPTRWVISGNTPSWGGPTWQSGVWRPFAGGAAPMLGQRCLLLGPDDADTDTVSAALTTSDYSTATQTVAGAAMADAAYLSCRYVVGSAGYDSANSHFDLIADDSNATATATVALSAATPLVEATHVLSLSALSSAYATWDIIAKLRRSATCASGNRAIPRVYVDDVRVLWSPYKGPARVLLPSQDLARASATSITGTTAGTGFAVANVANAQAPLPYMTGTVGSGYVELDLGSAQTVSMCALLDSALVAGESWVLKHGSSSPATTQIAAFPVNEGSNSYVEFARTSARYWRIEFTKASGAADKAFRIGEIVLGCPTHLQRQYSWGARGSVGYQSATLETPYGVRWAYERSSRRAYSMPLDKVTPEDAADWRAIYADTSGGTDPVLVVPDPSQYPCYYGYLANSFAELEESIGISGIGAVQFTEQPRCAVQT